MIRGILKTTVAICGLALCATPSFAETSFTLFQSESVNGEKHKPMHLSEITATNCRGREYEVYYEIKPSSRTRIQYWYFEDEGEILWRGKTSRLCIETDGYGSGEHELVRDRIVSVAIK